jgi:quinolinate synthase
MRERIIKLKSEKNAIILAHNYQLPEIQDIADVVGDSLELAIRAKEATEEIIVFCGVDFMAETAKILNPGKKVILPVKDATCPLAHQLTRAMLTQAKKQYPGAGVVVYVNSTAESKALADVVCTSANAVNVVRSLAQETIIFGPDSNLAGYVQRNVPEKTIIPVPAMGYCYVHTQFTPEDIEEARRRGGKIICHPECPEAIQKQSDVIASTGGMVRNAKKSERWNILTEKDMAYRLRTLYPDREFYAKEGAICHDMKLTTLPALLNALETEQYEITLPGDVMDAARNAIERMIAIRG